MERAATIAKRVSIGRGTRQADEARAAREQFKTEMEHFAAAFRHEFLDETIRVYWLALKNIPAEIRTAGLTDCLKRHKFFPTVAEVLNACADVIDRRRAEATKKAQERYPICALCNLKHCEHCHGTGLRDVQGPRNVVEKCPCKQRERELVEAAGQPIARPALPAAREEEPVA
jgi:hypothetical protein